MNVIARLEYELAYYDSASNVILFAHSLNRKTVLFDIDRTLSSATTPGDSGPGSNGNEGVLHIPQS